MHTNRLRLTFLALLTTLAVVLAACGGDGGSSDGSIDVGDLGPDPATMAPADAPIYAEAVVRPSGTMLDDFNSALGKLLQSDDPSAMIRDAIDGKLAESEAGITLSEDVDPWLGTRVGGFITGYDASTESVDGAAVIAVTDVDAAQAAIEKAKEADPGAVQTHQAEYQGVSYETSDDGGAYGFDGDFLIAGTEQGFKDAVDAAAGDSLAESETASAAREEIPDNSLFSGFVDTQAAVDLIKSSADLSPEQVKNIEDQVARYGDGPVDFWGTVEESTMTIAAASPAPEDGAEPSDLVASFPADAWLAFASSNVGTQIQASLEQLSTGYSSDFKGSGGLEGSGAGFGPNGLSGFDIDPLAEFKKATGLDPKTDFDWIGDVGAFVQGSSIFGLGGGLVIEATDEDAASAALDKVQAALGKAGGLQVTPTDAGFDLQIEGAPVGAQVALEDGKVVLAAGADTVDDVLSPDETLEDSDRFNAAREALGEDMTASFFLDFTPVVALVESSGSATSDPGYQAAKPYLDSLDYLVAGSRVDGDRTMGSIVLGVKEAAASNEETAAAAITP